MINSSTDSALVGRPALRQRKRKDIPTLGLLVADKVQRWQWLPSRTGLWGCNLPNAICVCSTDHLKTRVFACGVDIWDLGDLI